MVDGTLYHSQDPPVFRTHIRYEGGHVEDFEAVEKAFREWLHVSLIAVDSSEPDVLTICTRELDERMEELLQSDFEALKVRGSIKINRRVICQDTHT